MADPVEQIFLQARAPTGSWEGPIQSFWHGRRAAQQDVELGQQERRLQLEEQLLPLRMEAQRLTQIESGLDIKNKLLAQQRTLDVKAGESKALDIMLRADKLPNGYLDDSIFEEMHALSKQNPAVFTTPVGVALLHNFKGARVADEAMQRAKNLGLPATKVTIDPETGKQTITYGSTTTPSSRMKEIQAYLDAKNAGNTELADLLHRGLLEKGVTPGALEKDIVFLEGLKNLTPEERRQAQDVRMGLAGRAGVEHSTSEFVLKNLPEAIKAEAENPTGALQGGIDLGPGGTWFARRTPKTADQLAEELRSIHRAAVGRSSPAPEVQEGYDRFKLWMEKRK